jgi:hypothetical protein
MVCASPLTVLYLTAEISRAPSYFTQFFEEQLRQNEESGGVRTLYIDRDPSTFRDVAQHLQGMRAIIPWEEAKEHTGYHIKPTDGSHFVKLFADAQFYSCRYFAPSLASH